MKKKIILLLNTIVPKGGTNKVVAELVNEIYKKNDVKIISIEGKKSAYSFPENVQIFSLHKEKEDNFSQKGNLWEDYYKIRFSTNRVLNTIYMFTKLPLFSSIIKKEKPFAILSFQPRANLMNILAKKIFKFDYKCIICERNFNSIQYRKTIAGKIFLKIMKIFYKIADVIVTNSIEMAKDISLNFFVPSEKIKVIYNPFDLKKIEKLSNENIDEFFFHSDVPVILNVGRLIEQKNHKLLLCAFSKLLEKHQCRLIILSEGEMEEELKKLAVKLKIQDYVHFLGWQDNPYKFMKRATLFVLSSDFEGFPNVLVEAMACSCPVISTDCPSGPKEILDGEKYGILIPVGDKEKLAGAILKLLKNNNLRKDMSKKAYERAKDFDIKKIAIQFEDLWR